MAIQPQQPRQQHRGDLESGTACTCHSVPLILFYFFKFYLIRSNTHDLYVCIHAHTQIYTNTYICIYIMYVCIYICIFSFPFFSCIILLHLSLYLLSFLVSSYIFPSFPPNFFAFLTTFFLSFYIPFFPTFSSSYLLLSFFFRDLRLLRLWEENMNVSSIKEVKSHLYSPSAAAAACLCPSC